MPDKAPDPSSAVPLWRQFSIASLMVLTAFVACLSWLYTLFVPFWPAGLPKWTAAFFALWTGAVIAQTVCFFFVLARKPAEAFFCVRVLARSQAEAAAASQFRRVLGWGIVGFLVWLEALGVLLIDNYVSVEPMVAALAAIHLLPLGIVLAAGYWRALRRREELPWRLLRFSVAMTFLAPAAACTWMVLPYLLSWLPTFWLVKFV